MFSPYRAPVQSVFPVFMFFAVFMLLFVQSAQAISSLPTAFDRIAVRETAAPDQLNSARCYQIAYYKQIDGGSIRVYPTLEERQRDSDLILARVVKQYLDEEYESQGKYMDEHLVEDADLGKIIDLVSTEYVSKAWKSDDVNFLRQYILKNKKNSQLYTLHVYLEHFIEPGKYFSGLDINPIILDFNEDNKSDLATFITVNYSDK